MGDARQVKLLTDSPMAAKSNRNTSHMQVEGYRTGPQPWIELSNIGIMPDNVQLADIEKLFDWFNTRWPRDDLPNERHLWWQTFWSCYPRNFNKPCQVADEIDRRLTLCEFQRIVLSDLTPGMWVTYFKSQGHSSHA